MITNNNVKTNYAIYYLILVKSCGPIISRFIHYKLGMYTENHKKKLDLHLTISAMFIILTFIHQRTSEINLNNIIK